jgi:hypothetical protein
MNAQDETALAVWQANRHLDREKMAKLLDECMSPPPYKRWRHPPGCPDADWCSGNSVCYWHCQAVDEYEAVLRDVAEAVSA